MVLLPEPDPPAIPRMKGDTAIVNGPRVARNPSPTLGAS
jgi:hypothetical protein